MPRFRKTSFEAVRPQVKDFDKAHSYEVAVRCYDKINQTEGLSAKTRRRSIWVSEANTELSFHEYVDGKCAIEIERYDSKSSVVTVWESKVEDHGWMWRLLKGLKKSAASIARRRAATKEREEKHSAFVSHMLDVFKGFDVTASTASHRVGGASLNYAKGKGSIQHSRYGTGWTVELHNMTADEARAVLKAFESMRGEDE